MKKSTKHLTQGAVIAALYIVLTLVSNAFGLANRDIQLRISEALYALAIFTPSAVLGLCVGCLLSNILVGGILIDVIFGSIATLIGAFFTYRLRKYPIYALIPPILSNAIIIPPILSGRRIKEIRIVPKANARFFEIQYTYEADCKQKELNTDNALALDFGIDNLITAVSSAGKSFIIDGRRLKSVNQRFNKENARLQSIKDKQHYGKSPTNRQKAIARNRNNKVNDYMSKAARRVTDYCIDNDIGTLVVGYNVTFQRNSDMGKRNNQNFVSIPYGRLRDKLRYLCEFNGITYVEQEESYTSKASFWDRDDIPVYSADDTGKYEFSGRRICRGLYRTSCGKTLNADVNGALNIMRKSRVVDTSILYSKGEVDTPVRIRIS